MARWAVDGRSVPVSAVIDGKTVRQQRYDSVNGTHKILNGRKNARLETKHGVREIKRESRQSIDGMAGRR